MAVNPSSPAATSKLDQWAPPYKADDGNVADEKPTFDAPERMVPDFMGRSGQGNNQNTDRPKGSV
jgi:hypothetical protein